MAKSKSYGGLIFLLVVVVAGAAGSWYYFNGKTDKEPEFQTTKVGRGNIVQSVTATGDLQPVLTVDVGAQVSGQIKEVLVDFNSQVKMGDVLAKIDESTPVQKLNQAKADLASAEASNQLIKINFDRTKDLAEKKLVSQQELDSINAQLAQSNATLLTRIAAVENAKLDLSRCTITSPIDGIVLDRKTDVGRTVNSSMNAPTLFTLVNDLTKMRIMAAVAEADIGTIAEGQEVKFSVDAFPSRVFNGKVSQVRNAASANQSVVSYATVIEVSNDDLKLKPGMTANVSIIVAQKNDVLRVANSALRVRLPQELQPKGAGGDKKGGKGGDKGGAVAGSMTDDERMRLTMEVIRDVGYERGTPPSPDQIAKAKKLAKDKGLDGDLVAARMSMPAGGKRGGGGGGGGDRGSRGSGGFGGGGGRGGSGQSAGFNNTIVERQLYKLADPNAKPKVIEPLTARLGISDGAYPEVLNGLSEGDTLITAVIMPGAAAPVMQAGGSSSGMQNPFSGSSRGGFSGSSSGMRGR
ncbi:MAG TPA: efflux RND transporter periplasmic adaptor subunit [Opitutaceae bacterium]|nr:efflux RND transporter periplasmic adaptor subunit [Opitutaceae bacterium]